MEMKNPSRGEPAGASISAQNQPSIDIRSQPQSQELRRLPRERLGAAGIMVRLMRECEALRAENQRFRIAVRGFDIQPESPFPLLSGAEVVNILHPEAHQPTANNLNDTTDADKILDALHRALGGFDERQ